MIVGMYALITNILLLNLLIAMFNQTVRFCCIRSKFSEHDSTMKCKRSLISSGIIKTMVWMLSPFFFPVVDPLKELLIEYQSHPLLPGPFIVLNLLVTLISELYERRNEVHPKAVWIRSIFAGSLVKAEYGCRCRSPSWNFVFRKEEYWSFSHRCQNFGLTLRRSLFLEKRPRREHERSNAQ